MFLNKRNIWQNAGVRNVTALKDKLVAAGHQQARAIEQRHDAVIGRWQRLLNASHARRDRLVKIQEQYRLIEELYLQFAKRASAFNSWFENAEEDLTDPVRCNSVEEINALREAHAQFRASLVSAQADFEQLKALDKQIKSFNVAANPYTWFTMEALDDTWQNLQRIIGERDRELEKEARRQDHNDRLRQEFARHGNGLYAWLTDTHHSMMEVSGPLDQQHRILGFVTGKKKLFTYWTYIFLS